MNPTHVHLVITHLPIFGSILGALVLGYGIWCRSNPTKSAAYLVFIISAIGAGVAYLTGEEAEETVENLAGVSENMIEQHEEFALYALIGLIVLGVAAIFSLVVNQRKSTLARPASVATLLISLISFVLVARTGYLGGQIRHTEINSASVQNIEVNGSGEQDDDE